MPVLADILESLSCSLANGTRKVKIDLELEIEFETPDASGGALATLADVERIRSQIMSKIQEFADAMAVHQTQISASIDGLSTDVASLKAKIEELLADGTLSEEDTKTLDGILASTGAIAEGLAALDALTPPPAPVEEPAVDPDPLPEEPAPVDPVEGE